MAVSSREENKKRIVDYLDEPDDDEEIEAGRRERGGLSSFLPLRAFSSNASLAGGSSYSPRSLLAQWLLLPLQKPALGGGGGCRGGRGEAGSGLGCLVRFPKYSRQRRKKKKKKKGKEVGPSVTEVLEGDGDGSRGPSTKPFVSSGEKSDKGSLNLGMGVGLVFLLTRCAAEFKRMTELQAQMEILLKEIKNEVQRKDISYSFLESSNGITFSAPDCSGFVSTSKAISSQSHIVSFHQEGAKCATESDGRSNHVAVSKNKNCLKVDQLESELEAELEHLQLDLDREDSFVLGGQHKLELANESSESSENFSFSFEPDMDPQNKDDGEFDGVSALELERRLHELLHTKQQERIAELEYALECTKRNLVEKEIELRRLRNIANLPSPHQENNTG